MQGVYNIKLIDIRGLKDALHTCLAAAWRKLVQKEIKICVFESIEGLY
jgi:hypothetical protein